ncbi:hypothetical protein HGA88_06935 [Candidatus Roizmanbacteria bacterium]|nr:hypothetical protein [Candidatus Roizmanbacteria bacterium]
MNSKLFVFFTLLIVGIASRLVPHEPNFVAVGAVSMVAGYYFSKKVALLLPASIMIISDCVLGFHATMPWVYGSFIAIALGSHLLKNKLHITNVIALSFASSFAFFVTTNFGVWIATELYMKNFSGLVECYYYALPFFRNTVLSDLFYSGIFFSAIYFAQNKNFLTQIRLRKIMGFCFQ